MMEKIILASQSPRRKQLLEWAEIPFEIKVKETAETFPPDLAIEEVPVFIAREKARVIQKELLDERIVLAADTIVVLNKQIIGKPKDREDAIKILSNLSGETHQVITGVVIRKGEKEWSFSDITRVQFHPLTLEQITYYIDHYLPYDKAGAYAIQEWIGVVGIHSIAGDFYNVMGLPVSRVVQTLQTQVF
ncbi:Maf family nucleotide pyrophosphatase [Flavihumibacter cheonanensis]|uniref:Maf family nucleotide pyrophosphatase n=1 Tax=Flavihumibacter cheonanensis TaxID=1442385 RepID=UPI001EF7F745|nr:Maf family nucleotide pyrophosphatase [Flavihumibacter cheonanensis]MCG7751523.1 Maf family nucleotide pyrophosphatase [Flavihumibacter cheonanensis]